MRVDPTRTRDPPNPDPKHRIKDPSGKRVGSGSGIVIRVWVRNNEFRPGPGPLTAQLPWGSSYSTYLVFKLNAKPKGLEKATASVRFTEEKAKGTDDEGYSVFIDKSQDSKDPGIYPQPRSDGWKELNLGDFVNNRGRSSTVEARIFQTSDTIWKSGIIIKGIEIRPN